MTYLLHFCVFKSSLASWKRSASINKTPIWSIWIELFRGKKVRNSSMLWTEWWAQKNWSETFSGTSSEHSASLKNSGTEGQIIFNVRGILQLVVLATSGVIQLIPLHDRFLKRVVALLKPFFVFQVESRILERCRLQINFSTAVLERLIFRF